MLFCGVGQHQRLEVFSVILQHTGVGAVSWAGNAGVTGLAGMEEFCQQETLVVKDWILLEEVGEEGALRVAGASFLALQVRLNAWYQLQYVLVQIPDNVGAAGLKTLHVLSCAAGAIVDTIACSEQIAKMGDGDRVVVKVGDVVAVRVVQTELPTLGQRVDVAHHADQVTLVVMVALNAFTRAAHILPLTALKRRDDQKHGHCTNHRDAHADGKLHCTGLNCTPELQQC